MNRLSITQKRWLVSLHVLCSVAFMGPVIGYLALMAVAATTGDGRMLSGAYAMMHVLDLKVVRPGAVLTALTGVLLSVLTNWGLVRYYWIIAKEALTVAIIAIGAFWLQFPLSRAAQTAADGMSALQNPAFVSARNQLWVGILIQLVLLAAAVIISVFKPWGRVAGENSSGKGR